eukprot:gene9088-9169_t
MNVEAFHFGQVGHTPGRRQAARVRLSLPGKVIFVTGHEPCQLDDLSQTGASMSVHHDAPAVGDSAVLMVNGVEAFGEVIWRSGTRFGLCFDEAVPKQDVVRLRAIHDHYESLENETRRRRARDFVQGRRVF